MTPTATPAGIREVIEFTFSLPPVKLRRNHGQGKFTAAARAEYSALMHMEALAQGWRPESALTGSLIARVDWFQTGNGDTDNCLAGAKAMLDALGCAPKRAAPHMTYLGVFTDDAQIVEITARRHRVWTKDAEQLIVTLHIERRGG